MPKLEREIERFMKIHNKELAQPFRWPKDAATLIGVAERIKSVADLTEWAICYSDQG